MYWSLKTSITGYLALLQVGHTFSAEQALVAVKASNKEAKVRSVSYFTHTSTVLSRAVYSVNCALCIVHCGLAQGRGREPLAEELPWGGRGQEGKQELPHSVEEAIVWKKL